MNRMASEVLADNCLGLAAQLAYYFFLALFPALLFITAIISFIPVAGLLDAITAMPVLFLLLVSLVFAEWGFRRARGLA